MTWSDTRTDWKERGWQKWGPVLVAVVLEEEMRDSPQVAQWWIICRQRRNCGDTSSVPELGRCPGEGDGNPLQCSCLENSMDRGAWRAAVLGVAKSRTWLSSLLCSSGVSMALIRLRCLPSRMNHKNGVMAPKSPVVICMRWRSTRERCGPLTLKNKHRNTHTKFIWKN